MKVYVIAIDKGARSIHTGLPVVAGGLFSFDVDDIDTLKRMLPRRAHFDAYGSLAAHAEMIQYEVEHSQ